MTLPNRMARPEAAPALFRLLSDSALSRAALGACGFPLALLDAAPSARIVTYVNPAFEKFFGFDEREAVGRPLAALLFRGDEALLQRVLSEAPSGCQLKAWGKDGAARHIEIALGAIRCADGRLTHWAVSFSDRSELERLRTELETLRAQAASV